MNRKGDFNAIKTVIIAAVLLFILTMVGFNIANIIASSGPNVACQASILKASTLSKSSEVLDEVELTKNLAVLKCNNLPDLTVKKSQVIQGSKISDASVKKIINDKLFDCWKTVGKGLVQPFGKLDGKQVYCLVCSDVMFDDDFIQEAKDEKYTFTKFVYWQTQNSVPGLKKTYFEEFYGVAPTSELVEKFQQAQTPLDFSKNNVVVWTIEKTSAVNVESPFIWATMASVGGSVHLAYRLFTGLFAGDYVVATGVHLVPRTQLGETKSTQDKATFAISEFCTKLVNY